MVRLTYFACDECGHFIEWVGLPPFIYICPACKRLACPVPIIYAAWLE